MIDVLFKSRSKIGQIIFYFLHETKIYSIFLASFSFYPANYFLKEQGKKILSVAKNNIL